MSFRKRILFIASLLLIVPLVFAACEVENDVPDETPAKLPGASDLLQTPIRKSVFVRLYNIDSWLAGLKNWEMSAGNVDGIYENIIMPHFRDARDPRGGGRWRRGSPGSFSARPPEAPRPDALRPPGPRRKRSPVRRERARRLVCRGDKDPTDRRR
jgi:hypothetical protein